MPAPGRVLHRAHGEAPRGGELQSCRPWGVDTSPTESGPRGRPCTWHQRERTRCWSPEQVHVTGIAAHSKSPSATTPPGGLCRAPRLQPHRGGGGAW